MSAANIIYQQIETFPLGKPFTTNKFKQYVSSVNLRQILSRLSRRGIIEKITHEIYAKPEVYRGYKLILTGQPLVECIEAASGETVITHGATAINQLGITTQLPMSESYYYTGKNITIKVNNQEIKLVHINKKYTNKSNHILELILSAAYYLGKENFTLDTLYKIEAKVTREVLFQLRQYMPAMPQLVSNLFFEYYKGIEI